VTDLDRAIGQVAPTHGLVLLAAREDIANAFTRFHPFALPNRTTGV